MTKLRIVLAGCMPLLVGTVINYLLSNFYSIPFQYDIIGIFVLFLYGFTAFKLGQKGNTVLNIVIFMNIPAFVALVLIGIQEIVAESFWRNAVGLLTQFFYLPFSGLGAFCLGWMSRYSFFKVCCAGFVLMLLASYIGSKVYEPKFSKREVLTAGITAIFVVVGFLFMNSTPYGVWTDGLRYMHVTPDEYAVMYHSVPGECTLEIDLNDLDSNTGKRIWEDEERYIEISSVDVQDIKAGGYRIFFRSHGAYDLDGGSLITGLQYVFPEGDKRYLSLTANLISEYNGRIYECSEQGHGWLNKKDGDIFGYYLFPSAVYDDDNVPLENAGTATITLSNLTEWRWSKV